MGSVTYLNAGMRLAASKPNGRDASSRFHRVPTGPDSAVTLPAQSLPAEIKLTRDAVACVDALDLPFLRLYKWWLLVGGSRRFYAAAHIGGRVVLMHRLIMQAEPGVLIDHRDGNGLNNVRLNLRRATRSQNIANSRSTANKTGLKGVDFDSRFNRWRARISCDGRRYQLGSFGSAEEAAEAYDKAAVKFFGEFAATNAQLRAEEARP